MPSNEFISELARTSVADLAPIMERYIREACAADPSSAVQALTSALYSALPTDDDEDPPRLLKVADFMEEVGEPPPSLVPDFLPSKKLICLAGAAKQGKSLVGLEFLHSISTGRKLMGRFPLEESGSVAYFGLEDGGHEIKDRLTQRGITDIDNFYVCWQSFDMATAQGLETFKKLISEMPVPPSLIVIDTAREAFRVRDWNDATVVSQAISPLRKWAHKNCTIILITHTNKDKFATGVNKISGSGALVSSCDSFMILENQKVLENGDLRWNWEMAGRGMKTTKHILEMDTNNLHIRVLEGEEIEAAKIEEKNNDRKDWHRKIANTFDTSNDKRATVKQISEKIEGKYDFVYDLIREMVTAKDVRKTEYTQQNPTGRPSPLYELTTKGASTYLFGLTVLGKETPANNPNDDLEGF